MIPNDKASINLYDGEILFKDLKKIHKSTTLEKKFKLEEIFKIYFLENVSDFEDYQTGKIDISKFIIPDYSPDLFGDLEEITGYSVFKLDFLMNMKTSDICCNFLYEYSNFKNANIKADEIKSNISSIFHEIGFLNNITEVFKETFNKKSLKENYSNINGENHFLTENYLLYSNCLVNYEPLSNNKDIVERITIENNRNHFKVDSSVETDSILISAFRNLQILVPFMIDGGSVIDFEDKNWSFIIYFDEERIASFITFYKFERKIDLFKVRISQVVTLPMFRNKGYASKLTTKILQKIYNVKDCLEVTVEDPTDAYSRIMIFSYINMMENQEINEILRTTMSFFDSDSEKINSNELKRINQTIAQKYKVSKNIMKMIVFGLLYKYYSSKKINEKAINSFKKLANSEKSQLIAKINRKKDMKYIFIDDEKINSYVISQVLKEYYFDMKENNNIGLDLEFIYEISSKIKESNTIDFNSN